MKRVIYRADRRNAIIREAKEVWPGIEPKWKWDWRDRTKYLPSDLRFIRSRRTNFLGEPQR